MPILTIVEKLLYVDKFTIRGYNSSQVIKN